MIPQHRHIMALRRLAADESTTEHERQAAAEKAAQLEAAYGSPPPPRPPAPAAAPAPDPGWHTGTVFFTTNGTGNTAFAGNVYIRFTRG